MDTGYSEFQTMPLELLGYLGSAFVGSGHEVFEESVPYESDS